MGQKQQLVVMKGTKDGLTLYLDDNCSFQELIGDLEKKLLSNHQQQEDRPLITVNIKAGNRYLSKEQEEEIRKLIRSKDNLVVDSIDSNVISKEAAIEWKQNSEIMSVTRVIRSGQVLEVPGDILLIGDVNPGGTIMAGGNIFVMGSLRGVAHAGCYGNEEAIIAASHMKPAQLRISEYISRAPDSSEERGTEMECAYIDEEKQQITLDRLQTLSYLRPDLTRLERGM
ncbi:septum site-determining protein MinC [Bacillus solimangrovi]|nr:septum site-determining protein MinC [Bacillus solimangrovi]